MSIALQARVAELERRVAELESCIRLYADNAKPFMEQPTEVAGEIDIRVLHPGERIPTRNTLSLDKRKA